MKILSSLLFALLMVGAVRSQYYGDEITKLSDFILPDLNGTKINFSNAEGHCVLVVNTASYMESQYVARRNMHWLNGLGREFPGLFVIAVPSNTFGREPLSTEQLKIWFNQYFALERAVPYTVLEKTDMRTSPLFSFLATKSRDPVRYDFNKFLVQKDGVTVKRYGDRAGGVRWRELEYPIRDCLRS